MSLRPLSRAITCLFAVASLTFLPAPALATPNVQWLPATTSGAGVSGYASAYDSQRHLALLYGGRVPSQHLGPGSNTSEYVIGGGPALSAAGDSIPLGVTGLPGARENASLAYDPVADRLWLFGGDTLVTIFGSGPLRTVKLTGQFNDLWYQDRAAGAADWHRVTPLDSLPSTRYSASLVVDVPGRQLILFGGRDSSGASFSDVWTFALDGSNRWRRLDVSGTPPSITVSVHAASDPLRHRVLYVGGQGAGPVNGFKALVLAPSPQWQDVLVAGTPPSAAIAGVDMDPTRDAVMTFSLPGDLYRVPLSGTPTWQALPIFNAYASSQLVTAAAIHYDPGADVLILPQVAQSGIYPQPIMGIHQRIALERAFDPPVVTTQFLDDSLSRGRIRMRWQVTVTGALLSRVRLEARRAVLSYYATVASGPDSATNGVMSYSPEVQAGDDSYYRLSWTALDGDHFSSEVHFTAPPAPRSMAITLDSAFVLVGRAHLQVTLANDSLTAALQPVFERRTGSGGWAQSWPVWPDDARRMTLLDSTLARNTTYEYAIRYVRGPNDTVRTSFGQLADTAAVPLAFAQSSGVRALTSRWHVASRPGFVTNVELQVDNGPWQVVQPGIFDAAANLNVTIAPLRLGTLVHMRLAWPEQGVTRYSAVLTDVVPAAQATATLVPYSDRVDGHWQVTPIDTGLVWRVQRATGALGAYSTVATTVAAASGDLAFAGQIAYDDHAVAPGVTYRYRIVVDDGVGADTLAAVSTTTLRAPVLFAKHVTPQRIDFDWYAPDAGTFNLAIMRNTNGSGEIAESAMQVGDDGHAHYTTFPTQEGDRLVYRARWQEGDNLVRYSAPDTTVMLAAQVDTLGSKFGTYHVLTRWSVHPVDSTFFVTLERSDQGAPFSYLTLFRTSQGPLLQYDDTSAKPGRSYSYRLSWVLGTSAEVRGATGQVPLAGVAQGRPDRITVSWLTLQIPGEVPQHFAGTFERRVSSGPWSALGTVSAVPLPRLGVGLDSLGFDDFTAPVGQLYEYRVTWIDQGDTLHTAGVAAAVPVVSATLFDVNSNPTNVTVRWQVMGDDPSFAMRVLRRESTSSVWDTLGLSHEQEPGIRAYVDNATSPGHLYSYKLLWQQAALTHTSEEHPVFAIGNKLQMGRPSPNPCRGEFSLPIGIPDAVQARLSVYDITGRERATKTFTGPAVFQYAIPRGQLKAGVYFVRLDDGRTRVTQRVVVAP